MRKRGINNLTAGIIGLGVMVVLSGVLIGVSGSLYHWIARRNIPVSDEEIYNPGIYKGSTMGYGGPVTVQIKVSKYAIEDIKIEAQDETPEIGKAAAEKLEKEIWLGQSHKVESISGATITSDAIKKALAECFGQAAKEGTKLADMMESEGKQENAQDSVEELLSKIKDGTYHYQDKGKDENGFSNVIDLTVKDHKITSLSWDAVNEEGVGKRILSAEGKYVMTENGPKWYEQADALAQYVLAKQTTEGLMNQSGKSDAVASVSIYIGGFLDSLKECLESGISD